MGCCQASKDSEKKKSNRIQLKRWAAKSGIHPGSMNGVTGHAGVISIILLPVGLISAQCKIVIT